MADDIVTGIPIEKDFPYSTITINRSDILGSGSYGYVCHAKCGVLPCAAKTVHKILFHCGDQAGVDKILNNFISECQLLRSLLHPNIVQFIGVCTIQGEKGTPVLLTELMDESLWRFITRNTSNRVPVLTQLSIMYDVAKALAYLHNQNIIHRDLSSNNILLLKGSTAKVTDFGMAKLRNASKKCFTQCPGTAVFMAPEALHDSPQYSNKLDIFSWAVVSIHLLSGRDPDPASSMKRQINSEGQEIYVQVPELERRAKEIAAIDSFHPLLSLTLCSLGGASSRPSADELCGKIDTIIHKEDEKEKAQKLKLQNTRESEERRKEEDKRTGDQQKKAKGIQLSEISQGKEKEEKKISHKKQSISLNHNHQQDHSTNNGHNSTNNDHNQPTSNPDSKIPTKLHVPSLSPHGKAPFSWSTQKNNEAPCVFPAGSSITTLANKVFLSRPHSTIIHIYDPTSCQWSTLPVNCPVENFTLVAHIGKILAVGGIDPSTRKGSKSIYSYDILNPRSRPLWSKDLIKDMYYERFFPAVVSAGTNLIVAGGIHLHSKTPLNSVEIHTGSNWYTGYPLLMPIGIGAKALISEDNSTVYIIGGTGTKGTHIQCISLEILINWSSGWFLPPLAIRETWKTAPSPVSFPGVVMVARQLVLMGGVEDQRSSLYSNNVYIMMTSGNKYNISVMPRARGHCLATVLPGNEKLVMVVGGCGSKIIDFGNFEL